MTRTLIAALLLAAPLSARADDPKPEVKKAPPAKVETKTDVKPGIDAEAKKVIEKAVEAHGGKAALEKYPASSSKLKGDMTVFGLDVPFTGDLVAQRPDKIRNSLEASVQGQKIEVVQIVNGNNVKSMTGGMAQKLEEPQKQEMRQMSLLQEVSAMTPLLGGDKFNVKAEKDEKVGDAEASVVQVSGNGLKPVRLFFDKKTGLLLKMTRKALAVGGNGPEPTEVTEETVVSDYKTFEGVKMPTKSVVTHDGKKFMTLTVSDVKLMDKADPKLFTIDN